MISLPPSVRIFLYGAPVDGRMGFDALSGLAASALGLDRKPSGKYVIAGLRRQAHLRDRDGLAPRRRHSPRRPSQRPPAGPCSRPTPTA